MKSDIVVVYRQGEPCRNHHEVKDRMKMLLGTGCVSRVLLLSGTRGIYEYLCKN